MKYVLLLILVHCALWANVPLVDVELKGRSEIIVMGKISSPQRIATFFDNRILTIEEEKKETERQQEAFANIAKSKEPIKWDQLRTVDDLLYAEILVSEMVKGSKQERIGIVWVESRALLTGVDIVSMCPAVSQRALAGQERLWCLIDKKGHADMAYTKFYDLAPEKLSELDEPRKDDDVPGSDPFAVPVDE